MENWEGNLVDRALEWKGWKNKGKNYEERGIKKGKQRMREGAWDKGEGLELITQVKDGEDWGRRPCTRVRVFSSTSMGKGA